MKKDGSGLLKSFTDKYKKPLGPSSKEILAKENQEIRKERQRLKEAEKQLKEHERVDSLKKTAEDELQNIRNRRAQTEERIRVIEEEDGSIMVQTKRTR